MAINETAKTEERNSKLFLRDNLDEILSISREGKDEGIDTGVAMDIFLNAVRHGEIPDGEAYEVKLIMDMLFHDWDFSELKSLYDAQTEDERQADMDDFDAAVDEYFKAE